jgi:phenylacetate-CoA oxygenase PaaI subunit
MDAQLSDLVRDLADNKLALGRRFSEWANSAPALEAAIAAAAMTKEETGHARSLYACLHDQPDSAEAYLEEKQRQVGATVSVLRKSFQGWPEFIAASVILDRAMAWVCHAAQESSHEPLRHRATKIVQEERYHRMYGQGWLKRLAAANPYTLARSQAAVNRVWEPVDDWLKDLYGSELATEGYMTEDCEAVRAHWRQEAESLLQECGIEIPNA